MQESTGLADTTGTVIQVGDLVQIKGASSAAERYLYVISKSGTYFTLSAPGAEVLDSALAIRLTPEIASALIIVERAG